MPVSAPARLVGLRLTRNPQDPCWELPWVGSINLVTGLVGWMMDAPVEDNNVPEPGAMILARAITRSHTVTFPYVPLVADFSSDWQAVPEGWVSVLQGSALDRARGKGSIPLVCTHQADVASRLFYVERFSWSLKSQLAVLSALGSGPPRLAHRQVRDLLDRLPLDRQQLPSEVLGFFVPAVDGDFAGSLVFDLTVSRRLEEDLAEECRVAGVSWDVVPELEFKGTAWFGRQEVQK